jgi:glyoxylase-like metal-dependent hydrolase (beta-lactamase superfamily II)
MLASKIDNATRSAALEFAGQQDPTFASPLNVTLIETPSDKILVDVGSGTRFMNTAGQLSESLEAAGVDPDKITEVIYTHAHPDHIWGTINDFDELSFPNAAYHISEAEWNFWMSKDVLTKLPKQRHGFAVGAQRNLKAVRAQLNTIKPDQELMPGINVISTPGHTPGHVSIEVGSGKGAVVILGDALTHPVISFQHPEWRPATDQEPDRAIATRKRLLDQLAADANRIIGYHLPIPGTGRVVRKDSNFKFTSLS